MINDQITFIYCICFDLTQALGIQEDYLEEFEQIKLIPDRKVNLSGHHSGCIRYLQSVLRKRIETTFSLIARLFPRKIHAVTTAYQGCRGQVGFQQSKKSKTGRIAIG